MSGNVSTIVSRTSTRARVEHVLAQGIVLVRAFDLSQAAFATATGSLSKAINPTLDVALLSFMFAESLVLGWWLIGRRSVRSGHWPLIMDIVVGMCSVGLAVVYLPPLERLNVWAMWSYPLTLSTAALIGLSLYRWQWIVTYAGILAAAYVAVVAIPLASDSSKLPTALSNAFAYPGFAIIAHFFARFVRKLGDTADIAKARVTELERDHSRALIQLLLSYLRLDGFAEADDTTRLAMVAESQAKYHQVRAYFDDTSVARDRDAEAQVRANFELHRGLSIRTVIDLEHGADLPEEFLAPLHHAIDTALGYIEQYAPDAKVTVTVRSTHEHLEVIVQDDGQDLDGAQIRPGFDIAEILNWKLAAIGGKGSAASVTGHGARVRIVIPIAPA